MRFSKPKVATADTTIYTTEIYTQGGNGVPVTVGEPDEQGRQCLTINKWMDTESSDIVGGKIAVTNDGIITGTHVCETGVDISDATALAENLLSGKTAYVATGKVTGTMIDRGAVAATLNAGGAYTIPAGYHNGSGKVTAKNLSSQTVADATAEDISVGKTAWVNGVKVTGTLNARAIAGVVSTTTVKTLNIGANAVACNNFMVSVLDKVSTGNGIVCIVKNSNGIYMINNRGEIVDSDVLTIGTDGTLTTTTYFQNNGTYQFSAWNN